MNKVRDNAEKWIHSLVNEVQSWTKSDVLNLEHILNTNDRHSIAKVLSSINKMSNLKRTMNFTQDIVNSSRKGA